jgi:DNA-binding NtrC family response regulator
MIETPKPGTARVLIADDNSAFVDQITIMVERDYRVRACSSAEEAIGIAGTDWPDVILLDIHFPGGMDGISALREIRRHDPSMPIIMLTHDEGIRLVVESMKEGAFNYIAKSEDPSLLLEAIRAALRHRSAERTTAYLDREIGRIRGTGGRLILGSSAASKTLLEEIERAASADIEVLITGETGTGKELVAREIHRRSKRQNRPLIATDVAALPETMVESSLFGHEKGAFTGAGARSIGAFEAASGGTLFLDEIGNLAPGFQAKMLRVLQERRFRRLGGFRDSEIVCDVRVLAATNRDLEAMIKTGDFMEELYYRINVYRIKVPSLAERRDDIPALAEYFVRKHHVETGSRVTEISEAAVKVLAERSWPGNIRQLEHAIKAAMVRAAHDVVTPADLGEKGGDEEASERSDETPGRLSSYHEAKARAQAAFKQKYLEDLMREAGGVVNEAARIAGLPPSSLRKMLRETDIERGQS